ncbi:hypothetical protein [Lentzea flava]|uniref:K+-transporting ATPase, KdpF subunit n=1 Tax=Lentzea flava TaxID=103732 RepID=A0ABQ2UUF6_9PSEU|nr:hypothetical protein [Lentzea flava]MCP2201993.1 hypothetical protein [Lentzea flava]GGU54173.1 hypothetical protein GCM10010178_53280 [Lentzea flava]
MHASGRHKKNLVVEGSGVMADMAYALLLIGSFVVLALTVRGLEKL